jgi:hypothetical protein
VTCPVTPAAYTRLMTNGNSRAVTGRVEDVVAGEWVTFPGGELEGRRPKALCPRHRAAHARLKPSRYETQPPSTPHDAPRTSTLCFECYRTEFTLIRARERALKAAAELDTASEARFQSQLPFEPVNYARLDALKTARTEARTEASRGIGQYADKRRHAQIEARHALRAIAAGIAARRLAPAVQAQVLASAAHAVELQLPEAWLPYVMSR